MKAAHPEGVSDPGAAPLVLLENQQFRGQKPAGKSGLRAQRTAMATNPRSAIGERADLRLVRNDRSKKQKRSSTLMRRALTTLVALALLAAVLRYLPPGSRNAQAQAGPAPIEALPDDLQVGSLQMSRAPVGETLFLDGVVKNVGVGNVVGATAEVDFLDEHGRVVGRVEKPIAGIVQLTGINRNEFARNPIQPNEMRFFRVEVERAPPAWNQEVPELKFVKVTAQ